MQELRNLVTSSSTPLDYFLPSGAVADGQEPNSQVSPDRHLEFDDALLHHLPRFQSVAVRWLRNVEDAEDAVQEAMLSAFKHIASFEGRARMSTWLMAILINTLRMQLRRRPQYLALALDETFPDDQHPISDCVADKRPTPEQTFEEYELRRLLIRLTGTLPPPQRRAMELRQWGDLSIKEAAQVLGVSVGTIKAQLARGRVKLTQRVRDAITASKRPEQGRRLSKDGKQMNSASETPHSNPRGMSLSKVK